MKYTTLVLSGGGVSGISHLGAIKYLEENNLINIDTYICSSVGSLIGSLLAVGYKAPELYDFIYNFNMSVLRNIDISNLIFKYGLDNGHNLIILIKKLLNYKTGNENITFKELYEKYNKKLIITASCLNDNKIYYFNYENEPNLSIYMAVRMSISIPFIFTNIQYKNKLFVDGGLMNNYPIKITKNIDRTIGIYLDNSSKYDNINNIESYIMSIFNCLFKPINKKKYKYNTIFVNMEKSNMVNFELTNNDKKNMFLKGYETAEKFIKSFKLIIY